MKEAPNTKNYEKIRVVACEKLKYATIYYFLKNAHFSENYIKNLRNNPNAICLNGKFVTVREKIKNGDILQLDKSPNKKTDIRLCAGNLDILYEDEDYLVVNKPHNLSCTPNRRHYSNNLGGMICNYMQNKDPNFTLRIVNRLDRETAGIVMIAKSVAAYNLTTDIKKTYYALCQGKISQKTTIDAPILTVKKDGINQLERIISPEGKPSVTHVKPIKFSSEFNQTLVELHLETGRTHQIRVHMKSIGHPLVGDTIYAKAPCDNHAMLVLKRVSFIHFRSKKETALEVDFPSDWHNFTT